MIDRLFIRNGNIINGGTPVCTVRLTQDRDELTGVLYIPIDKGKRVKPGQTIQLSPNGVDVSLSGSLIGIVRNVSEYPVSLQAVEHTLGNPQLSQMIMNAGGGFSIMDGAMTAGMFVAFQSLMGHFQEPVNNLLGLNQALQTTEMQMHRLDDVRRYDADKLNYPDDENFSLDKKDCLANWNW